MKTELLWKFIIELMEILLYLIERKLEVIPIIKEYFEKDFILQIGKVIEIIMLSHDFQKIIKH